MSCGTRDIRPLLCLRASNIKMFVTSQHCFLVSDRPWTLVVRQHLGKNIVTVSINYSSRACITF